MRKPLLFVVLALPCLLAAAVSTGGGPLRVSAPPREVTNLGPRLAVAGAEPWAGTDYQLDAPGAVETPSTADSASTEPPSVNPILALQLDLLARGFDPGPLDGQDGPLTQRALRRSQGVPDPAPSPPPPPPPVVQAGDVWWQLALCESGGNPATNTGNGYYGAYQFAPSTWWGIGGTGYPHEHSYEVQLGFAQALQARSGWGQWPSCARRLGLL